ncbi:MAG: type II toxin-antitoxin system RelE/ParE family toxin [Burkholderiales bacterium]|nr:type II toxin-antitoxin system RelE/ParE family toxin [Burkholderiales bacterium]
MEFRAALDNTFASIEEHPRLYAQVYRSLHRALVRRFPYGVFYTPRVEELVVVAVLHTARSPRLWRGRFEGREANPALKRTRRFAASSSVRLAPACR